MHPPEEQVGLVDWGRAVERLLAMETVRSERRRSAMLASVLAFLLVVLLLLTGVPRLMDASLQNRFRAALPWVVPLMIAATLYELGMRRRLGRLWDRRQHPGRMFRYVNALVETSLPTAFLILAADAVGPLQLLVGAAPMLYFLFVFLTTLQLSPRLCLFSGFVAGAEFVGVALWFLRSCPDVPEMALITAPHQYVVKGLLFIIAGCVAGFVTGQIKGQFIASLRASAERDRAVSIFGQHVSPQVAEKLLKQAVDLGGEMRSVCVMFLDVRDFSRLASEKTPKEVVAYLNTLFSGMIDTINQHQGIVNKFLGDGLMAVFGAPADDAERCRHALGAALEIIREVERMNQEGMIAPTRIGIGLHMGEAVTGNVGSSTRKEYTVIGDVVNLAARIEQATKELKGQLLVSETVWKELDDERYQATDLGSVQLKGQAQPIRVYRLA